MRASACLVALLLSLVAVTNAGEWAWSYVPCTIPWMPRHSHTTGVSGTRIWLLGGVGWQLSSASPVHYNEVWASDDGGVVWSHISDTGPNSPNGLTGATLLYFSPVRGLIAIGGVRGAATGVDSAARSMFTSSDGVAWSAEVLPYSARSQAAAVLLGDRIFVCGGLDQTTLQPLSDCWQSASLNTVISNWTLVQPSTPSPFTYFPGGGRSAHSMLVHQNVLIVAGGFVGSSVQPSNDVWTTTDGVAWSRITEHAGWSPRANLKLFMSPYNELAVYSGTVLTDPYAIRDVWYTYDALYNSNGWFYMGGIGLSTPFFITQTPAFSSLVVIGGNTVITGGATYRDGVWTPINAVFRSMHDVTCAAGDNGPGDGAGGGGGGEPADNGNGNGNGNSNGGGVGGSYNPAGSGRSRLSSGAIAGITIACLFIVGVFALICYRAREQVLARRLPYARGAGAAPAAARAVELLPPVVPVMRREGEAVAPPMAVIVVGDAADVRERNAEDDTCLHRVFGFFNFACCALYSVATVCTCFAYSSFLCGLPGIACLCFVPSPALSFWAICCGGQHTRSRNAVLCYQNLTIFTIVGGLVLSIVVVARSAWAGPYFAAALFPPAVAYTFCVCYAHSVAQRVTTRLDSGCCTECCAPDITAEQRRAHARFIIRAHAQLRAAGGVPNEPAPYAPVAAAEGAAAIGRHPTIAALPVPGATAAPPQIEGAVSLPSHPPPAYADQPAPVVSVQVWSPLPPPAAPVFAPVPDAMLPPPPALDAVPIAQPLPALQPAPAPVPVVVAGAAIPGGLAPDA